MFHFSKIKKVINSSYTILCYIRNHCRFINSLRLKGSTYSCPFCKGNFSSLLPAGVDIPILEEKQVVGAGYRLDSICPRCYSEDRERLLFFFLTEEKADTLSKNIQLLHIAPEKNLSKLLKSYSNIDYLSADISSLRADVKMDITKIKYQNQSFDILICNHVLEHIVDDAKAIQELFRVLKVGGYAILQVPVSYSMDTTYEDASIVTPEDRTKFFGQRDHVRIYECNDYVSRLEKEGFKVDVIDFTAKISKQKKEKYRLLNDEKIFLCHKV